MPLAEASRRYGARLAIASLSALEKGVSEEGEVEVRVLHDGTNVVDTNRYICVMDGGSSPQAPDIKATMRHQSGKGVPHCGLTVDVKDAHKVVAVRPEDWPLVACQVYPDGDVYLNKRGILASRQPPIGGTDLLRHFIGPGCWC